MSDKDMNAIFGLFMMTWCVITFCVMVISKIIQNAITKLTPPAQPDPEKGE